MVKRLIICALVCLFAATAIRAEDVASDAAVDVFHCTFGPDWDVNYDRWPDRWLRKEGPDYPHYVNIEIADEETAGKCLKIDLDGAGAALVSPPIRVMSRFRYVLEAKLKTEHLERSAVVITIGFYDAAGRLVHSEKCDPIGTTNGWQVVRLPEAEPKDPSIERAVIGLEVKRGVKGDLAGKVLLSDVRLARLPRISVTTNNPFNVYTSLKNVVVKCELSGIREKNPEIRCQLKDSSDRPLDSASFTLEGRLITEVADKGDDADAANKAPAVYEGTIEWRPKIPSSGYYRVVVNMHSSVPGADANKQDRQLDDEHEVWLAVVPPFDGLENPARGEFGWSLPNGDKPLSLDNLNRLLPQVGINWIKLPVWYDATNPHRSDELIRFVELAGASNIEVVGVIDRPPQGSELATRFGDNAPIGDVLSADAADAWSSLLEPVMTRLSLRIRWWQLGRDFDSSFATYPDANKSLEQLRTKLFRFGQDVRVGLCWDWEAENQVKGRVSWDFQQACLSTPTSETKLADLLARKKSNSASRWVLVEPPSRGNAPSDAGGDTIAEQYREFVMNLVAAKEQGADAIIVPNPFNDTNGLMRANGMPAELLLPWRTTATMLGGAKFLGSIQLPGGSENRIFVRPDTQVVMVVWNNKPTTEAIYLGKQIRQFDIMGNALPEHVEKNEQVIVAGPDPKFVLGLHEAITRLRMELAFEHDQVPSVYSRPHPNSLRFHNYFPQGAGGSLRIVVPNSELEKRTLTEPDAAEAAAAADPWTIDPPQGTFKFARGEDAQFPFQIRLKNNAMYGKQPVRIEFDVEADERYQFSVYREMEVGTSDLSLQVKSHLDDEGTLIVEQLMTNRGKSLSDFKCSLYADGMRRQRTQVYRLGPAVDKKVYRFANGEALLGQVMKLEVEEINGERVLRYSFVVENIPAEKEDGENGAGGEHAAGSLHGAQSSPPANSAPAE